MRNSLDIPHPLDIVARVDPGVQNGARTVPLPRRVVKELERHLDEYVDDSPEALVFTNPAGDPFTRDSFRKRWWKPATKRAGLEGLRVHDLKHTFVAFWTTAGENPKSISKRAGHSSVAFTQDRYGHLYEDRDEELQDRLDDLIVNFDAAQIRPKRSKQVADLSKKRKKKAR